MTTRSKRAESRATIGQRPQLAKPARIPLGDRPAYPSDEGQT